jgi:hypothetical protein
LTGNECVHHRHNVSNCLYCVSLHFHTTNSR